MLMNWIKFAGQNNILLDKQVLFPIILFMISSTQKPLPINPITGLEMGKPSSDFHYNQQTAALMTSKNSKSNILKDTYQSINPEELQTKVNEFLASKLESTTHQYSDPQDQYHDQFCVCTDCVYERKLSKPSHTLFNLTMKTVYKQNFKDKSPKNVKLDSSFHQTQKMFDSFHAKSINEKQSSLHPKQCITLETIYHQEMKKETLPEKVSSIKNEDSLKFQGPFQKTTTYGEKFPGISGGNPYVKPTDKAVRQKFALDFRTTNSTFYRGQITERPSLTRSPDNIKTGLPLLCRQSTSNKFYNAPINSELYNKNYKSIPKKLETIHDKNQFASTTYGKSFYGPDLLEMVKHKKRLIRQTMSRLGM